MTLYRAEQNMSNPCDSVPKMKNLHQAGYLAEIFIGWYDKRKY